MSEELSDREPLPLPEEDGPPIILSARVVRALFRKVNILMSIEGRGDVKVIYSADRLTIKAP